MVASVRGERATAKPRSKSAPAPRGGRAPATRDPHAFRSASSAERAGLGPGVALTIAAVVILGGAVAGLALSRREPAPVQTHATPVGRLLASIGFRLDQVQVQGAPEMARADILRATGLQKGAPIVGVGLDGLRKRIEAVGWVKSARVVRLLPDTLVIAVVPRQPLAVWQHLGATRVVDAEGQVIGEADPGRFADLPLVVGEGAAEEAREILPLVRQRPRLMARLDALIRVDGRRWDLRLKDGTIVQLPAVGADTALMNLDQLDQKDRVLSLGLERIDLRNPDALVVRPRADAADDKAALAAQPKH
jgi:cell division protein FtsQ